MQTPTIFNLPSELKQKIFKSKKLLKIQDEYNECLEELYKIIHHNNMNVEKYFEIIIKENSVDDIKYIDGKPECCLFETFEYYIIFDNWLIYEEQNKKSEIFYEIYLSLKKDIIFYEKQLLNIIKQKLIIDEKDLTEINQLIDINEDDYDDYNKEHRDNMNIFIENSTILKDILNDIIKRNQANFKIYADLYEKYHRVLHQYKDIDEIHLLRKVDNFVKCNFINKEDESINKYLEEEQEYFDPNTYDTFVKDYNYFLKFKRNDFDKFDIVKIFLNQNTNELNKMKPHDFEKECGFDDTVYPYFIKSMN